MPRKLGQQSLALPAYQSIKSAASFTSHFVAKQGLTLRQIPRFGVCYNLWLCSYPTYLAWSRDWHCIRLPSTTTAVFRFEEAIYAGPAHVTAGILVPSRCSRGALPERKYFEAQPCSVSSIHSRSSKYIPRPCRELSQGMLTGHQACVVSAGTSPLSPRATMMPCQSHLSGCPIPVQTTCANPRHRSR